MKRKNVLLLSMSTLPKNMEIQNYYFSEENEDRKDFYGYSQLEPITKFLIQKLKETSEKLDKIVIMTSKEALKDQNTTAPCPAVPFYLQRIQEFLLKDSEQEVCDQICFEESIGKREKNEKSKDYLSNYQFGDDAHKIVVKDIQTEIVKLYDEEEKDGEIHVKPKEEINIFFEVIDHIKATGDDIDLYLDMQGGDRNAIAQMNAIVNLLEDQGVRTAGRYAIAFDNNNNKHQHPINEVSKKYTAYQLIGAMQAFKKYGRGQSLIEYFNTPKKDRDKKILSAIETASDAIRLCDIGKFDTAVSEIAAIKKEIETEKIGTVQKEKSELDIVFEDIQKDYGKFLDQSEKMYIAKIKWCLEKGFIQQALTIIESKMPEYLYDREIITVNMEGVGVSDDSKEMKISEILSRHKKSFSKQYLSDEHVLIEQLSRGNEVKIIERNNRESERDQYKIPTDVKIATDLVKKYPQDYKDVSQIDTRKGENKKEKVPYSVEYNIKDEYREGDKMVSMSHFLKLHWILKKQRNQINHSSDKKRFSKEKLERYIRFYVELGELLEIDPI